MSSTTKHYSPINITRAVAASTLPETKLQFLWGAALLILFLFALQMLGVVGSLVSALLLSFWALKGSQHAIKALLLTYLISLSNPGIFSPSPIFEVARWIVLLAATSRVAVDTALRGYRVKSWFLWLASFCLIAAVSSVFVSPSPTVSVFKILVFFVGFFVVLQALEYSRQYDWLSWFFTVWSVVLFFSLPLLLLDVGYLRNGVGFQGVFNQPQVYGIFFSVPAVYLGVKYLLRELRRDTKLTIFLLAVWPTVIASQARTGIFAGVLAVLVSVSWIVIRNLRDGRLVIRTKLSPLSLLLGGVLIFLLALFSDEAGEEVATFLTKAPSSDVSQLSAVSPDEFLRGRSDIIAASWSNFLERPFTGIGFGVPSNLYERTSSGSEAFGLPTSAPIEKSFMPTAVLEETGIIGALLLTAFLAVFAAPVIRFGRLSTTILLLTAISINLGEMVFFSASGGIYVWLCIGISVLLARHDRQARRQQWQS